MTKKRIDFAGRAKGEGVIARAAEGRADFRMDVHPVVTCAAINKHIRACRVDREGVGHAIPSQPAQSC